MCLGWKAWQRFTCELCEDKHVIKIVSCRQWLLCQPGMLNRWSYLLYLSQYLENEKLWVILLCWAWDGKFSLRLGVPCLILMWAWKCPLFKDKSWKAKASKNLFSCECFQLAWSCLTFFAFYFYLFCWYVASMHFSRLHCIYIVVLCCCEFSNVL